MHRLARRKNASGRKALKASYGRLIATAKRTAAQGRRILAALSERIDDPNRGRLAERLDEVLPRPKRSILQAERRVLQGDPVPSPETLASIFEPHTQVIPRFKPGRPVEFGRKLWLDEVESELVTGYAIAGPGRRPGSAIPD